ncbi:lichenan operon transcriptional antiterminator [Agromyces flavus]|uniref:Lichenan operon transcriptional antiterminator n=1 Tax=Agromyces flavus TaxID=589382 RepID=A0A1H1LPA4_9MICO|nr:PTS sugar transporter subunit IIA [Agromyces flavus]MCP2368587.1 lichenan operon transcriptional antiterminator [Agromyces flavus]GGI48172.1 transcriptional antiterminator [Agromyces flavus]SDR76403.1 transcriptional antiterminator, BglG family [Agromyces flavus]
MPEKWERLVEVLAADEGWTTAARLSERLGVSDRTVRTYAAQANRGAEPVVLSGPDGYRLDRDAWTRRARARVDARDVATPDGRRARLIRDLADAPDGLDVHEVAAAAHVSESTVEADLGRVRSRLEGTGLSLARDGGTVRLVGPETAVRRLVGALVREEGRRGIRDLSSLREGFAPMDDFRRALLDGLADAGYAANEYALDDVLLHVAIALDRVARDRTLDADDDVVDGAETDPDTRADADAPAPASREATPDDDEPLAALVDELVVREFGVRLPPAELRHLARLIGTRAATRRSGATRAGVLREIVDRISRDWLVELGDDEFIERLALHVDNLAARAAEHSYSRNPLTASIKAAYPLIYDLAVYLASELARLEGITVNDDEIAYLAMHLGAQLERTRARGDVVRIVVVAPQYHDARALLVDRLRGRLGDDVELAVGDATEAGADGAGEPSDADLVVAVLPPREPLPHVVTVSPFPTDDDVERVRNEVARLRRGRRRARLASTLSRTIEPDLFVRGVEGREREDVIRLLGDRLITAGAIDEDYVTGTLERERMSSTAFTDLLAVPHAMAMTASRSAIAIAIDEHPIDWGGAAVHVVALIAFAADGRAEFQAVFDQFVEAFSEPENVRRLVRGAVDYPGLLAELSGIMAS